MKVSAGDISIVFQGPVRSRSRHVLDSIASARKHFPGAEIIFSTWDNEAVDDVRPLVDVLVQSAGVPDVYADPLSGARDNAHRQIITTRAGLEKATRRYCIKLRSDTLITSAEFAREEEPLLTEHPLRKVSKALVALDSGTYDPARAPFLFHLSDLAMFGAKEDMLAYWSATLDSRDIAASWPEYLFWKCWFGNSGFRFSRLSVEQRVMLNFLQRQGIPQAKLSFLDQVSEKLSYISEASLLANFILVDAGACGLDLPEQLKKRPGNEWYDVSSLPALAALAATPPLYRAKRYPEVWRRKYLDTLLTKRYYKGVIAAFLLPVAVVFRRFASDALLQKIFPAKK